MPDSKVIVGDARCMDLSQFRRYRTIVCDPPWEYAERRLFRLDRKRTRGIGASLHYDSMKTEEICAMPVEELAAKRCHLYLWATCPLLPDALKVMRSWKFKWATVAFVWVKLNENALSDAREVLWQTDMPMFPQEPVEVFFERLTRFGPGFYTGSNVELVLLGTRGRPFKHARGRKASQVVYRVPGEHSVKPEVVQDRIEWMYPKAVPMLELFGRRPREGWTVFGNDIMRR